jgi:hypothetical protein
MKTHAHWRFVALVVVVAGIALLAGCSEAGAGGGGDGGSTVTEQEATEAYNAAFTFTSSGPAPCLNISGPTGSNPAVTTIGFNNCTDENTDIVITGTATLEEYDSGRVDYNGSFTLSNAAVSAMSWSFSITSSSFTGSITVDGEIFDIATVTS